jgi:hypothetical protein
MGSSVERLPRVRMWVRRTVFECDGCRPKYMPMALVTERKHLEHDVVQTFDVNLNTGRHAPRQQKKALRALRERASSGGQR